MIVTDQLILERRLEGIRQRPPSFNSRAARAALEAHLHALGIPCPPIRWAPGAIEAYARAAALHEHTTYTWAAGSRSGNTPPDKIVWYREEEIALRAAWQTARQQAEPSPPSAKITDIERQEWMRQENEHAQRWSALLDRMRSVGQNALRACAGDLRQLVWSPLIDAFAAGLWVYGVFEEEILCVRRPLFHLELAEFHN